MSIHRYYAILAAFAAFTASVAASPNVSAANRHTVTADSVFARSQPGSYVIGRLYTTNAMDIQYVDSNGWAYGYIYGHVNRCGWAQYTHEGNHHFTDAQYPVEDRCRHENLYLDAPEFSNGEFYGSDDDGEPRKIVCDTVPMWDNWLRDAHWGNHNYRGELAKDADVKLRYVTEDGVGAMVHLPGTHEWVFTLRACIS